MSAEPPDRHLLVGVRGQTLTLFQGRRKIREYPVSTAKNGAGEIRGSGCTPRGMHRIRIKIGSGREKHSVFVGRRPTGEVYSSALARRHPARDWILTRILWLTGLEPGRNRGGAVDSLRRFIYIHGTPDSEPMGRPCSHGCIRMRNTDLIGLFDLVRAGTLVDIQEGTAAVPRGQSRSPG